MDREEKISRSVDNLERIYAVVIAFAVTKAIDQVFFRNDGALLPFSNTDASITTIKSSLFYALPNLLGFLCTLVPFYHGMNRHLCKTYIERDLEKGKEGWLILDFFIFFMESCVILSFAALIKLGNNAYWALLVLCTIDIGWGILTHWLHYKNFKGPWKWVIINISTCILVAVILFFFQNASPWFLAAVCMLRTIFDYVWCWNFYFPDK